MASGGRNRVHRPIGAAKKHAALSFLTGIKHDGAPSLSSSVSCHGDSRTRERSACETPPRSQPIAIRPSFSQVVQEAACLDIHHGEQPTRLRSRSTSLSESPTKKSPDKSFSKSRSASNRRPDDVKRFEDAPGHFKSGTPPAPGIQFFNFQEATEANILDLRVILHGQSRSPFCMFSIKAYNADRFRHNESFGEGANASTHRRLVSRLTGDLTCIDTPIPDSPQAEHAVSFHWLLEAAHSKPASGMADDPSAVHHRQPSLVSEVPVSFNSDDSHLETILSVPVVDDDINIIREYRPFELDDPDLRYGKYCTFMPLQSYNVSLLEYARPAAIKKDLNEHFHEKFPDAQITLSKLRSLKNDMLDVISDTRVSLDLGTVSLAYVYFEKLVLLGKINKSNRKYLAAVSMLLAAKFSDATRSIKEVIEALVDRFRLHRKTLLAAELPVLVALQFSLLVPDAQVLPHFGRLSKYSFT